MTVLRSLICALVLCAGAGAAQDVSPKFQIAGDTLIYDTVNVPDALADIEVEDVDPLLNLLSANPQITMLELNSGGGSVWASQKISDIVIDFGLDTRVNGDCDSSCVTIFLAGQNRSMTRGSRMGFHQVQWSSDNIQDYYEREADEFGWDSPWDFAEWMYLDTQQEVYLALAYMVARGVDPGFAIQSIRKPDGNMWRPHRTVLRAAGVLTE